jgi:transcriptional regulator with XRE-family HTH domain
MSVPRTNGGQPDRGRDESVDAKAGAQRARDVHSAWSGLFETGGPAASADAEVVEDLRAIANRVRRWREEAGLTLQELARRSGVAGSTIQKVESLQMIPTLGVVLKIARGLDRAPSELVRNGGNDLELVHLRPQERHFIGGPDGTRFERMVGDLFEPQLEAWRITLQPGRGSGRGLLRFDGEAIIFCEVGEVNLTMGDETHILSAGDVLHYKATLPHGWRNLSDEKARFLIVGTLPRALRHALHRRLRAERTDEGTSE